VKLFNGSNNKIPLCLPGFEKVNRYNDVTRNDAVVAKIVPGEFYVTCNNEMITTVLGSCIAVCAYDMENGIGGMNHFMLPSMVGEGVSSDWHFNGCGRYGDNAMKNLLKCMIKHGAKRHSIKIKVFGGGQILASKGDVGGRNIEFINEYVAQKQLVITGMDVGDVYPRKVQFFPDSGLVQVKKLKSLNNDTIFQREQSYECELTHRPLPGGS